MIFTIISLFLNTSQIVCLDYENISVDKAKRWLDSDPSIFLIDVRRPGEYDDGHINGSVNIYVHDLYSSIHKIPEDNSTGIIVYCDNGIRSKLAAEKLVTIFYSNVSNMEKGFNEWLKKGYPYVYINGTESKITTDEVSYKAASILIASNLIVISWIQKKRNK